MFNAYGGVYTASNYSTLTLSWNCGEPSDVIVEISMINSDSLFDFMVAGLLPISWVRLFSIGHGLNALFFSGSILHVKCVGYDCGFDLGDSSSPARI